MLDSQRQKECEKHLNYARKLAGRDCRRNGVIEDYDDAVGEAFLALVIAADGFDPSCQVRLITFAHRVIGRRLGRRRRLIARRREVQAEHGLDPACPATTANDAPARGADHLRHLLALIDRRDADALLLRELTGMSWREVGASVGCGPREARARAARARDRLRELAAY